MAFHGQEKRVVVVGGTGTISGAVVNALVERGHSVTIFTRGQSRRQPPSGVRILTGDRHDRQAFEETMRREAFDVAYDMLCYGPAEAESDLRAFEGVEHFIHTSTVCTFGRPPAGRPANEETPLRPTLPYGREKVRADEILLEAHRRDGFPVTILKPTHTWGPGLYPIRQLGHDPRWIARLLAGKPLLIAGTGRELWSLCHAEDSAQAYADMLLAPGVIGESYIVGGATPLTWLEYHRQVAEILEAPLRLLHAPVDAVVSAWPEVTGFLAGMTQWDQWYDISKLQAALPSYQPHLTLVDRLWKTMQWIEEAAPPPDVPDREDDVLRELKPLLFEPLDDNGVSVEA